MGHSIVREPRNGTAFVALAATVVVALMVGFAYWLADTQQTSRTAVETRFRDRALVTSALTDAVLTSAASSAENARLYGSGDVSDRELAAAARQGRLDYVVLLDDRADPRQLARPHSRRGGAAGPPSAVDRRRAARQRLHPLRRRPNRAGRRPGR